MLPSNFFGADSSKINGFVFFEHERGREAMERDGGQRGGTKAKAGSSSSGSDGQEPQTQKSY